MNTKQLIVILISICILASCQNKKESWNKKTELLLAQNDSLRHVILRIKTENDSLRKSLSDKSGYWYIPARDGSKLIKSGINDPAQYITNALFEKTNLIPTKAVLGGTMHFEKTELLGKNWLIADYTDGHIYGKSIFKYEIKNNNQLEFKILASARP